jgi:hypothetical protein
MADVKEIIVDVADLHAKVLGLSFLVAIGLFIFGIHKAASSIFR